MRTDRNRDPSYGSPCIRSIPPERKVLWDPTLGCTFFLVHGRLSRLAVFSALLSGPL